MAAITDNARVVFADGPSSNPTEPNKADIIRLFALIESILGSAINGLIVGNAIVYQTRAALFADLARPANTLGIVYGDSNPAYNGVYVKNGASGSGSWVLTNLALPSTFASDLAVVITNLAALSSEVAAARFGEVNLGAALISLRDTLAASIGTVQSQVTDLSGEVTAARGARPTLAARLQELADAIAAVKDAQADTADEVEAARGGLPDLAARLQALADAIAAGGGEAGEAIAELRELIELEIENRIAAIQALDGDLVTHKNNDNNPHGVTKAQVGLGDADNTPDLEKPVSTAQAAADAAVNQLRADLIDGVPGADAVAILDPAGFAIMRLLASGAMKTPLLDFGFSDAGGGFSIRDVAGFLGFGVTRDGVIQMPSAAFSRDATSALAVQDPAGFVGMRLDLAGSLKVLGRGADVLASAQSAMTDIYTLGPKTLPRWRLAQAAALQASGTALIAFVGDSNTMGWNVNGENQHSIARSHPTVLAKMLDRSFGATSGSFFGGKGIDVPGHAVFDPRHTFGAGWSFGGNVSLAGNMLVNSTTTDPYTFHPGDIWDTAVVMVALTSAATLTIEAGGELTSFTPTVGSIQKLTVTVPKGDNSLIIRRVSGPVVVIGAYTYDSTRSQISVLNLGRPGWRTHDWVDDEHFYSPLNALKSLHADLYVCELGINNMYLSPSVEVFIEHLGVLHDAAIEAGGDFVLASSVPPNDESAVVKWPLYTSAAKRWAGDRGVSYIDISARFGSEFHVAYEQGWQEDGAHQNEFGTADKAVVFRNFLNSI